MLNEESDNSDVEQPMEPDFPEVSEQSEAQMNELPDKSREQYQNTYRKFNEWKEMNNKDSLEEGVMLDYFNELAGKVKPPTLWTQFSMLKHTISLYDRVDINNFKKLRNFLKKNSVGYQSKTTKVFTSKEIEKFLNDAPDNQYLPEKVALIFGIIGACKNQELLNLTVDDIEDDGTMALVKIPKNENNAARSFTVCGEFYKIYRKYAVLRPKKVDYKRFFLNYRYGKCFNQAIGHNKFSIMPKLIAAFLNLPNPDEYKANSFRRTSAMLLAHSGADVKTIQRHGGWTPKIAKDVIAETKRKQIELSSKITNAVFLKPSTSSSSNTNFEGEGSSEGSRIAPEAKRGDDPLFIDCSSDTPDEEPSATPDLEKSQNRAYEKKVPLPVASQRPPSTSSAKTTYQPAVHSQLKTPQKILSLKMIPPKVQKPPQKAVTQQSSEVCLRWGLYHTNMQMSFPSLLNSEEFVDVTLACEGQSIKCHKIILSSCSDYLATLLRENPCQHPIILMKDLKFWEIEALVRFMYKGEVNISHDKLPELLKAADSLQIKGLINFNKTEIQTSSMSSPQPPTMSPSPTTAQKPSESLKQPTNQKRGTKRPIESNDSRRTQRKSLRQGLEIIPSRAPPPEIKLEALDSNFCLTDVDILLPSNDDSSTSNYENFTAGNEGDPGGEESLDSNMQFDFHESENMADVHMDMELTGCLGEEHDEEVDDEDEVEMSEGDPGDDDDDEVWIVEDET
ncbi:uncharacterized protein LOC135161317 [Diachasmimorpha longicaudata]|uniref:uncharacterized protein LOC135161317 n=1 Tax=Diachasmimorpha longicaudata TaxID=58733 RepID=UPI0030B8A8E6